MESFYNFGDALVIDKFLPEEEHQYVWNFFQTEKFNFVNSDDWIKVYRAHDGRSLYGPTLSATIDGDKESDRGSSITGTQFFIKCMSERKGEIERFLECKITNMSAVLHAYPAGTGLSWHKDGPYKGAYTYYTHAKWGAHWGGELMIADGDSSRLPATTRPISGSEERRIPPVFDPVDDDRNLLAEGHGRYVLAKPNRLVIIRAGVNHAVRRVEPAAGSHLRCSISGFFE